MHRLFDGIFIPCLTESSSKPHGAGRLGAWWENCAHFRAEKVVPWRAAVVTHATMWPWDSVVSVLLAPFWGEVGPAAWWPAELSVGGERAGRAVAWRWTGPAEAGMTLGCLAAPLDLMESQACTREQNRICTCRPGWYCALQLQERCRQCIPLSKCSPGFGVATPGMGPGPAGTGDSLGSLLHGHQLFGPDKNIVSGGQVPATHVSTHPPFILSSSTPD